MQEPQKTLTSNVYYDLVSSLYHLLQAAQTADAYIQDAEEVGQLQVAAFFRELQQDANRQAVHAQELLDQLDPLQQRIYRKSGQISTAMQSTEH